MLGSGESVIVLKLLIEMTPTYQLSNHLNILHGGGLGPVKAIAMGQPQGTVPYKNVLEKAHLSGRGTGTSNLHTSPELFKPTRETTRFP